MYRCQITNKFSRQGRPGPLDKDGNPTSIPGEKLNRIVVQKRDRVYMADVRNEETGEWENVEIGKGWEIVKEISASDEGLALWNSWNAKERANFLKYMDR